MTPLQVVMMLHYYAIPEPYGLHQPEHGLSRAIYKQREDLIHAGYLYYDHDNEAVFSLTPKGFEYVERIVAIT